ncbi:aminomethyl-transferring glycine dehydrogenase subunit GcvPB [Aerococcus sanguinicola]|uniref:aminomethyl-transferring glycine dehydrogenase subunit GcvPB n=1 Tax=unclassified Aerococcus TaxID=2618060 RepID=UPI0008A143FE|nr:MULTISPECIES: aminomethyl-transferring glycine dehydrogenase subunit GcvPB [unclassified Aerococcus]MDK6234021.1 aminomethyl-transferring glycine dehydrogenase subunit GcvPB [Aerococcus sp. UMB10185]MDK6856554.1 aminomethyl-transferring glycine dehydrogenase subunit GcvPB [Aerococcus sp. UMB7533]MDK8502022.1 aminomethyl-transferring glycine dehydrogenase subunit GcvPB [Aerococcus sp. UMB1112A]OFN03573.1 glycine dehydrogenase (aminomethyl-transferring) [Aerococcus sp. HMSC062A02]OHO45788.1 g
MTASTEYNQTIFEISRPGRRAISLPKNDVEDYDLSQDIPDHLVRKEAARLPEVSELQLLRHYTLLSNRNFGLETGFYPLGSCTMKYNPKINEVLAALPGFAQVHPLQPSETAQGSLEVLYQLQEMIKLITGMDEVTMQPCAGAHGEWAGMLTIKAYHDHNGELEQRRNILIPDSAHGTNPATAAIGGFNVIEVKSNPEGTIDVDAVRAAVGPDTAGMMITNPSTAGLFEHDILEIAEIIHEAGGLLYYDGANSNAILGHTRPGDMDFDIVHLNLHKTFSGPHGGGGPGSGPIGVKKELAPFLPVPRIEKEGDQYVLNSNYPDSYGRLKAYFGNFGVNLKAWAYILTYGGEGLTQVSEDAVLNANYLKARLEDYYYVPFKQHCKHEFVIDCTPQKKLGANAKDVAKRLLDHNIHAPTTYFPLIVHECLMIEPTETEHKESLDHFCDVMIKIAKEVEENAEVVNTAPHNTPVARLDEALAARKIVVTYDFDQLETEDK